MGTTITTTVTELPESRVRVQAEVAPEEVRKSVEKAARALGRNVRVPGFRTGKVPAQVVITRIGRDAVLQDAVKDSLNRWYTSAIDSARIVPIGEPELDVADLPEDGEPLKFSIEIGVLPKAVLGKYKDLEVGRREPVVDEEKVDTQVETLRERMAKLETTDAAAEKGSFLQFDYSGTIDGEPLADGETRDQLIELGSDQLVEGLDEQLVGVRGGEERTVTLTLPAAGEEAPEAADEESDDSDEASKDADTEKKEAGSHEVILTIAVKEVKQKLLPDLDDEFAAEAGFDTLEELKDDIRERQLEGARNEIDSEFREAVIDAAVANATIETPPTLVEARARELWDQVLQSLSRQGINKEAYLRISGKAEEEILKEMQDEAVAGIKREAVLAAVAETEKVEPTEDDLLATLDRAGAASSSKQNPRKLLAKLKSSDRFDTFKASVAERKALELLVESAKPLPIDQAEAKEKIWTPEKKKSGEPAVEGLWTPGTK